jgi:hypothetical protein
MPTPEELSTIAAWRSGGRQPEWFRTALPMIKAWLNRPDWNPAADDYHAARLVLSALGMMKLDRHYSEREKAVVAAGNSCSIDTWSEAINVLSVDLAEMAAQAQTGAEGFRNELLSDLQGTCRNMGSGLAIACTEALPLERRSSEERRPLDQALASLRRSIAATRVQIPRDANGSLDNSAFIRAATAEWHKTVDGQFSKGDLLLRQRAAAVRSAIEKADSIEASRSLITLDGAGRDNSGARTLKARLETLRANDDLIRLGWGLPPSGEMNRWATVGATIDKSVDCGICKARGQCPSRQSTQDSDFARERETAAELRKLFDAVQAEVMLLAKYAAYQNMTEQSQAAQRNTAEARDALAREYEAAKARNAEAQARRGSPDDPTGKIADAAKTEEAQAKLAVDVWDCVHRKFDEMVRFVAQGRTPPSISSPEKMKSDCEAEAMPSMAALDIISPQVASPANPKPQAPPRRQLPCFTSCGPTARGEPDRSSLLCRTAGAQSDGRWWYSTAAKCGIAAGSGAQADRAGSSLL